MPPMPLFDRALAVGTQLPIQSQSTRYVQPWETTASADDLAAIVRACETARFDYVAVCDHIAIPDDQVEAMSAQWYDTIATLGWIAGFTEHVHLLSHVYVAAYRHPLQVAKSWTTLDHLSGGRAILGVGVGHVVGEFEALGLDARTRGRDTDTILGTVAEVFATGRHGDCTVAPAPARAGGPPIWIGGSSDAALRRVARYGTGWLPQGTPYDEMPAAIERIHQVRADEGIAESPLDVGVITANVHVGDGWDGMPAHTFAAPAEKLARGLGRLAGLGATHLMVRFSARSAAEYAEQTEAFGECIAGMQP